MYLSSYFFKSNTPPHIPNIKKHTPTKEYQLSSFKGSRIAIIKVSDSEPNNP